MPRQREGQEDKPLLAGVKAIPLNKKIARSRNERRMRLKTSQRLAAYSLAHITASSTAANSPSNWA